MTRPLPTILLAAALCTAVGCTPSRAKVVAMRDEPDPAKAAEHLADLLGHLEDVQDPPDPDRRCAMLDVGSDLARRVATLQQPGAKPGTSPAELAERMHVVLGKDLVKPVVASDKDLSSDGFAPAAARSATASWAAWKLAAWPSPADAARLGDALGREDILSDAGLQGCIAAALLAQHTALESDPALAGRVWDGALRVHARHDATATPALMRQLDALDLVVVDLTHLAAVIANPDLPETLRAAAIRQGDRILGTWAHAAAVPEQHRASLPTLATALAGVAASGPVSLAPSATEAAAGCVPWALAQVATSMPDGTQAMIARCTALRAIAATPGGALQPTAYLPGADLSTLRTRLSDQVLAALPILPAAERWPALTPLAQLAPERLAERLSSAWEDPARAADWPAETWLAGLRLVATGPALGEPLRRHAAEAAARIIATPVGTADPTARWDLMAEIAAPWPALRALAFAGAATAQPAPEPQHLERLIRILVAAALDIPEAERPTSPAWEAAIAAIAGCARQGELEPLRPGLRFLLDHAPDRLVGAVRDRAASGGVAQQEVVLLVDDALAGGRLPAAMRQGALDWQLGIATAQADEDLRLVAGASVLRHAETTDPRRARVAAALPILAAAGSR